MNSDIFRKISEAKLATLPNFYLTNYDQYFGLKPKDLEELVLNSRLMKMTKYRKHNSCIIKYKKLLVKT